MPEDIDRKQNNVATKLNKATKVLQSQEPSKEIFDDVMYILQHDYDNWFDAESRAAIQQLSKQYRHFTAKQMKHICDPPGLVDRRRLEDEDQMRQFTESSDGFP